MDLFINNAELNNFNNNIAEDIKTCKELINSFSTYTNDKFNLLHSNIRSINKNFEELEIYLKCFDSIFDVIILSETWNVQNTDQFNLQGYKIYYNESTINQNDGVIIYVKENIKHTISIKKYDDFKFISCELNLNNDLFLITGIYKSPNYDIT